MADKRQATISVFIIIIIIILVIFFLISYAGSDLGSNLVLIYANSATQTSMDLYSSINPLKAGSLTETLPPPTSTLTPTSSPTATATSTATPTLTHTLSFTGYEIIGHSVLERLLKLTFRYGSEFTYDNCWYSWWIWVEHSAFGEWIDWTPQWGTRENSCG